MSAATLPKLLTVEDLERIPDPPGGRYELHHGETVFVTYPAKSHKAMQRRLRKMLEPYAEAKGVVDTEFPYRPLPNHELWGADVAFVTQERYDAFEKWLQGSPELVIEVKSTSNMKHQINDKAMTALAGGCLEFWNVDEVKRTVTVYSSTTGMHLYGAGQAVPVRCLDTQLAVDDIFAEA